MYNLFKNDCSTTLEKLGVLNILESFKIFWEHNHWYEILKYPQPRYIIVLIVHTYVFTLVTDYLSQTKCIHYQIRKKTREQLKIYKLEWISSWCSALKNFNFGT